MAGCAPCQPFSKYTQGITERDERWHLLDAFSRLISETRPSLVTMENVPELARHEVHSTFVDRLKADGYAVSETVVECVDYGIPQQRRRLVLLASLFGEIDHMEANFGKEFLDIARVTERFAKEQFEAYRTRILQLVALAAFILALMTFMLNFGNLLLVQRFLQPNDMTKAELLKEDLDRNSRDLTEQNRAGGFGDRLHAR